MSILYADVNKEFKRAFKDILKKIRPNCTIEEVADGVNLVNKAKEKRYDLILAGLRIPFFNGLEASKLIRNFDKKTPIYILSMENQEQLKRYLENSGATGYINREFAEERMTEIMGHFN